MIKKDIKQQNNYHPDPRNDIEKFLHRRIPYILKAYGLGDIKFNFVTLHKDEPKCGCDIPEDGVMNILYDTIYKMAFIAITPLAVKLFEDKEYKTISDSVIHEVGHIVTKKLEDLAKNRHTTRKEIDDTVEETTETIARIATNLLSKEYPDIFDKIN